MAIEFLEKQHRDIAERFRRVVDSEDYDRRARLEELADLLVIHSAIEEKIFYPATSDVWSEEDLRKAVADHLVVKRALAELLTTDVSSKSFDLQVRVLQKEVASHVRNEEQELFPNVREAFTEARLAVLEDEMRDLMAKLSETPPHATLDEPTDWSAEGALEPPRARG